MTDAISSWAMDPIQKADLRSRLVAAQVGTSVSLATERDAELIVDTAIDLAEDVARSFRAGIEARIAANDDVGGYSIPIVLLSSQLVTGIMRGLASEAVDQGKEMGATPVETNLYGRHEVN